MKCNLGTNLFIDPSGKVTDDPDNADEYCWAAEDEPTRQIRVLNPREKDEEVLDEEDEEEDDEEKEIAEFCSVGGAGAIGQFGYSEPGKKIKNK